MTNPTLLEQIKQVIEWSKSKGIPENSTSDAQYLLYLEETGELHQAIKEGDRDKVIMEYGDRVVTIINTAYLDCLKHNLSDAEASIVIQEDIDDTFNIRHENRLRLKHNFTIEQALSAAIAKITKRKHSGFVDGKLVKEGE